MAAVALTTVSREERGDLGPPDTVGAQPGNGDRPSIAVLPFQNRSGEEEDEYFTDGMHDQIITHLTKIRGVSVRGLTSVLVYRGSPKNNRQIGRELNARYIVEGGVQRAGGMVRINVQLIDAPTDEHLWASTYDRAMSVDNVLAIQTEIVEAIVDSLRAVITPEERARIERKLTDNAEALDAFLRGKDYFRRSSQGDSRRRMLARSMLERAVTLDPEFSLAWAWLAYVDGSIYLLGSLSQDLGERVRVEAETATALAPGLPETQWAAASYYYFVARDFDLALRFIEGARQTWPNSAEVHRLRAFIQRRRGEWNGAMEALHRAAELDPMDPNYPDQLGVTNLLLRRYDEAEKVLQRAIRLWPDNPTPRGYLAEVFYYRDGDMSVERMRLETVAPSRTGRGWWHVEFLSRNYRAALQALEDTDTETYQSQYYFEPKVLLIALTHLALGDTIAAQEAFAAARGLLEQAVDDRPEDDRIHRSLGLAYAGLGLNEAAIREATAAVRLAPPEVNAMTGPRNVEGLAHVLAMTDAPNLALDQLEILLSIPARISTMSLQVDPRWDPLRSHPRFRAILERFGPN